MIKTVKKPWGYEEWLVLNDKYCVKKLYINAGEKLSLQYHEEKTETMFLEEGICDLVLVGRVRCMKKGTPYTIHPKEVHRLVAHTDTVILEVSTPEVEDVVRLADNYDRAEKKG